MHGKHRDDAPAGLSPGQAERSVVGIAYRKLMVGKELTVRERDALKRHEKEKEERLRWQFYGSIPQKHWRQMSGRPTQVLHE